MVTEVTEEVEKDASKGNAVMKPTSIATTSVLLVGSVYTPLMKINVPFFLYTGAIQTSTRQ